MTVTFAAGIVAGLFFLKNSCKDVETRSSPTDHSRLDLVDEMVLDGEVNNHDFYGIMGE